MSAFGIVDVDVGGPISIWLAQADGTSNVKSNEEVVPKGESPLPKGFTLNDSSGHLDSVRFLWD